MQLADGKYRARAVEWGLGETGTGTPQIAIKFDLLDFDGSITAYRFFTEKALTYTVQDMRTCGWVGDDLEQLDSLGNNEVEIVVENEEWDGKISPKVKWINPVGGTGIGMKKQMDDAGKRRFAALMKGKIRAADPKGAKAAAQAQAAVRTVEQVMNGGGQDDDIPF